MIEKGLLQKFDQSMLPNIVNVDPLYLGQAWDPGQRVHACARTGARTGWIYEQRPCIDNGHHHVGRLHRRRRRPRPAATCRCSTRATTSPACTSGPTASTGPPRRPPTSTPARRSSSTSSHRTSRRSTATRAPRSPRAPTPCRWRGTATPARRSSASPSRRRPRGVEVGARRAGDRAVDGQLLHPHRRAEPRGRACVDQLAADARDLDQGPQLPRLPQRHEEHRRADRRAGPRSRRTAT